uniref:Peroxin/Ferlin domain-containing protein n=1 Tax=Caenorhabditis tropicalis TaxID=1561998 RepID=A0A1I7T7H6_9PELO
MSETEWQEMPCSDGSSICTIVSSSSSSFAIDRTGRVLILILPTHIAMRERVEIYNNQRWIGIWRGTFFIDRPRYSDESGQISKNPSLNEINPGWSWEDQWAPHVDPRKYDKEGWQYSLSFLAPKWDKKCRMYHLVRRRLLKRHMRYTSHDQWVEISDEESRMFTELAIGGMDIMSEGELLLFALGNDGNIYRRAGIKTNNPCGNSWESIPRIVFKDSESDDITLISASPSLGTLIAITWDGKMFHRKGLTRINPIGITWNSIPTPKNKAVIGASIGTKGLWCITADGCVWFTRLEVDEKLKEHTMENITSEGYQLVTQGGVSKLSVTKNDQLIYISTREKIEIRSGINNNEPSGKRFEQIVDRGEPKDQRWISIHAGSVSFSQFPEYFTSSSSLQSKIEVHQFKKADWRIKVGTNETVSIVITDKTLEISAEKIPSKSIETSLIRSVLPSFQRLPQKYLLYVFIGSQSEFECFAFTEESSRSSFQTIIENIIRDYICSTTRSSFGECMWTVSIEGIVRWHCLAEMDRESKFEVIAECRTTVEPVLDLNL